MTSTSRAGRPRTRLRSAHIPTCLTVTSKIAKPRMNSMQRALIKCKGAGKGKQTTKKSNKAATVVLESSDSEDLEVDFPYHPPNQPHELPADLLQEPNPPADSSSEQNPAEEPQEQEDLADTPVEEPHPPAHIPAEDIEQPQNPGNPNPILVHPPIPMANKQLNWSHFRPEFSGTPNEDAEAHLLRTEDWMTTHDFQEDQKVGRFCLTPIGEARLWYATLNVQQQQLNWDGL